MLLTLALLIILVALDRASKVLLAAALANGESVTLIKGVLGLELLEGGNTGAAFGILQGGTGFLIAITVALIVALMYLLFCKRFASRWMYFSALLITAGGAGNLYDRVVYGSVTDFLKFLFMDFPVFNLADCYVTVGAAIMVCYLIFAGSNAPIFAAADKKEAPPAEKSADESGDA